MTKKRKLAMLSGAGVCLLLAGCNSEDIPPADARKASAPLASVACAAEQPQPLDVRLDASGRLSGGSFEIGLAAFAPGWAALGVSLDFDSTGLHRRWQVLAGDRPRLDAAFDGSLQPDGSLVCTWTATARAAFDLQCLGLVVQHAAADAVGRAWKADERERVFPSGIDGAGGFGGGRARRFAYPVADGRTLVLEWDEPVPYNAEDGRKWGGCTFFTRFGGFLGLRSYAAGETVAFRVRISVTGGFSMRPRAKLVISEGPEWARLENRKDILAGSALDFSGMGLANAPAGKYGWLKAQGGEFVFEGRPGVRQRFYGVNLCNTANYPSHADATMLVTRLRRLGYNSIRVHHHDDTWAKRPEERDKLDFLIAEAIRNGIYITTDLYVSRKVRWRDIGVDRDGDVPMGLYKTLCACYEPAYRDWCRFAEAFLRHVNPYTGRAYADEPGMPLLSLVNEGDLAMGWREKADDPRVRTAWKAFGGEGDAPALGSQGFRAFDDHLMRTFTEKATRFLRALGAKALLTNDNCGPRHGEGEGATPCFDYVDSHFYIDHPVFHGRKWRLPSSCPNESPLRGVGVPLLNKGYAKNATKPYAISEWNFSGPGKYRALGGIFTGARAAQDKWDALWRFAYAHSRDYFRDGRDQTPGYFDCATDPLGQAGDRASVCLFLRGDADDATLETDAKTGSMRIVSPRTCGGFSEGGDIDAGAVAVRVRGVPAAAWVSSLDGRAIPSASRLLAVHLTDVQGAGTVYADETRKVLLQWGKGCLVERGEAAFAVRLDRPEAYSVYALGTDGARQGAVPAEVSQGRLVFTASTARGVLHYEIVADK